MSPTLEQHLMDLNADVLKGWLRRMDARENRLVVPKENLAAFGRAVKKLG